MIEKIEKVYTLEQLMFVLNLLIKVQPEAKYGCVEIEDKTLIGIELVAKSAANGVKGYNLRLLVE